MTQQSENLALMRTAIGQIAVGPGRGRDVSRADASKIMEGILDSVYDPVQVAIFLIGLRMKGESIDELLGLHDALQVRVKPVTANIQSLYCLADPFDGYARYYPASPFLAPVLAALDLPTLMLGVHSQGPKHGITSHKVLRMAGFDVACSVKKAALNLENFGWSYLDQAQYFPKLDRLHEFKDMLVKRTALTTLERIIKPIVGIKESHLVLGYVHKAYPQIYSSLAQQAGYNSSLLIKGVEGGLSPALSKPIRYNFQYFNKPKGDLAKTMITVPPPYSAVTAAETNMGNRDEVKHTLELGIAALLGKPGNFRNSLVISAALILSAHRKTSSFDAAVEKVTNCLDNGSALEKFQALTKNN